MDKFTKKNLIDRFDSTSNYTIQDFYSFDFSLLTNDEIQMLFYDACNKATSNNLKLKHIKENDSTTLEMQ